MPQGAEDCLPVLRCHISFYKKKYQVAVAPYFPETYGEPAVTCGYYFTPFFLFGITVHFYFLNGYPVIDE